ncbi:MAG TPA: GNAT family N-acetyltransferase, partial [Pirellulales bacterium]
MDDELAIHVASHAELEHAHQNVFDLWSKGMPLAEHVAYRLNSPSHRRATWFVGTLDDRVVVSLGRYPLHFRLRDEVVSGVAIGSVYTVREFRGRGFAGQLLDWVDENSREAGAALSILYSDIDPAYYARRGYILCHSWAGWRDPCDELPARAVTHRFVPIAAAEHLARLTELYASYHGAAPLSVERNAEYWQMTLKKFPTDQFFVLESAHQSWSGYVRVGQKDNLWKITDFALADQTEKLAEGFYSAFLTLGAAGGARRIGGWLPDSAPARQFFEL